MRYNRYLYRLSELSVPITDIVKMSILVGRYIGNPIYWYTSTHDAQELIKIVIACGSLLRTREVDYKRPVNIYEMLVRVVNF